MSLQPTQQQVVPVVIVRGTFSTFPLTVDLIDTYDHQVAFVSFTPYDAGPKQLELYDQAGNYYFQGYAGVSTPLNGLVDFTMQDASELVIDCDASTARICVSGYRLAPSATVLFS